MNFLKINLVNIIAFVATLLMTGCTNPNFDAEHYSSRFKQYGYAYVPTNTQVKHKHNGKLDPKILKKYTDRIAFEIAKQVDVASLPAVAVTSFVDLDNNLTNTHPLGNKLAEDLNVSLKEQGYLVIDLNISDNVNITKDGSFVFDRQALKEIRLPYVLTGVLTYTPNGVNINSRLIAVSTSTIIAAYTLSMPTYVVENAFPLVEGQDLLLKDG